MEDLFSYFESYTRNKKTKDTQDISSYETKKKKVRMYPFSYADWMIQ